MRDNTILVVLGQKGSGKTHLTLEMLQEWERVIMLDTLGEYAERFPDAHVATTLDDALRMLERLEHAPRFRLALQLVEDQDVLDALEVAFEFRDVLIVVEEASMYCSPSFVPPSMAKLIRYGRHRNISQIYVARRPAEISREVTAQADVTISFRQEEVIDVKSLRYRFGADAERVRQLDGHRFMAWGNLEKLPLAALSGEMVTATKPAPIQGEMGLDTEGPEVI